MINSCRPVKQEEEYYGEYNMNNPAYFGILLYSGMSSFHYPEGMAGLQ